MLDPREQVERLAALNNGYPLSIEVQTELTRPFIEMNCSAADVKRCVDDLLRNGDRLPTPAAIYAWISADRGAKAKPVGCGKCDQTGWVYVVRPGGMGCVRKCECRR